MLGYDGIAGRFYLTWHLDLRGTGNGCPLGNRLQRPEGGYIPFDLGLTGEGPAQCNLLAGNMRIGPSPDPALLDSKEATSASTLPAAWYVRLDTDDQHCVVEKCADGHNRVPVVGQNRDGAVGVIHPRPLLGLPLGLLKPGDPDVLEIADDVYGLPRAHQHTPVGQLLLDLSGEDSDMTGDHQEAMVHPGV